MENMLDTSSSWSSLASQGFSSVLPESASEPPPAGNVFDIKSRRPTVQQSSGACSRASGRAMCVDFKDLVLTGTTER